MLDWRTAWATSIREKAGMAPLRFSALDANVVPGPLVIRARASIRSNVDRALASIDEELVRMAAEGPTDQEVERVSTVSDWLDAAPPRDERRHRELPADGGVLRSWDGLRHAVRPELLRRVTRDDVHAAARAVLDPAKMSIVVAEAVSRNSRRRVKDRPRCLQIRTTKIRTVHEATRFLRVVVPSWLKYPSRSARLQLSVRPQGDAGGCGKPTGQPRDCN